MTPATLARDTCDLTAPAGPGAVRSLRADAVKHLNGWALPAAVVDDAELVISELLTNSLLHGKAAVLTLRLAHQGTTLRIEVDDPDHDAWPRVNNAAGPGESGNGMRIVDRLSHWGFICAHGKTVYADIPLDGGTGR